MTAGEAAWAARQPAPRVAMKLVALRKSRELKAWLAARAKTKRQLAAVAHG